MIRSLRRRLTTILTAITGAVLAVIILIAMLYSIESIKLSYVQTLSADTSYVAMDLPSQSAGNNTWLTEMETASDYIIVAKENGIDIDFDEGYKVDDRSFVTEAAEKAVTETTSLYQISGESLPAVFAKSTIALEGKNANNSLVFTISDSTDDTDSVILAETYTAYNTLSAIPAVDFSYVKNTSYVDSYPLVEDKNGNEYRISSISFSDTKKGTNETAIYDLTLIQSLSAQNRQILYTCLGYGVLVLLGVALLAVINWFLSKLVLKPTEEGIKKQTEFVAAASHELRSPLAVLKCSLSAVSVSEDTEEKQHYLNSAEEETDRMGRLVDDLLLLAGNDTGKWSLNKIDFDADSMLIEMGDKYEMLVKDKEQKFILDLPEKVIGEIKGDKMRIQQIISILLDNAIEYSPTQSEITLCARSKKGKLYISVSDNGNGISDEDKKKIFDRFYRKDGSRTNKAHFGLGLSVAKELTALHGGELIVQDAESGGAKFILSLNQN